MSSHSPHPIWLHIFVIIVVVTGIYFASAALGKNLYPHDDVYFDYLADSFLRGHLDVSPPFAMT